MIFGTDNTDGMSILTASFLLGIMILPTIIGVTETSIRSVNNAYFEGALALGATKEASIFRCVIPHEIRYFSRCGTWHRTCHW